jgi:hypothetical protein
MPNNTKDMILEKAYKHCENGGMLNLLDRLRKKKSRVTPLDERVQKALERETEENPKLTPLIIPNDNVYGDMIKPSWAYKRGPETDEEPQSNTGKGLRRQRKRK